MRWRDGWRGPWCSLGVVWWEAKEGFRGIAKMAPSWENQGTTPSSWRAGGSVESGRRASRDVAKWFAEGLFASLVPCSGTPVRPNAQKAPPLSARSPRVRSRPAV